MLILKELLSVLSLCWPMMKLVSNPQIPLGVPESSKLQLSTTNSPLVSRSQPTAMEVIPIAQLSAPDPLASTAKRRSLTLDMAF